MATRGSFAVMRFRMDPDFYARPAFRSRTLQLSFVGLCVVCAFSGDILFKNWKDFSPLGVALVLVALCLSISLFRMVLRGHRLVRMLLTTGQACPVEKGSSLEAALRVLADTSNGAMLLSFSSVLALMVGIASILARH